MVAIRTVAINRYITPLREGGSLPAIVSADDGFKYVLKFRGAGQGIKALISELIGGELARAAGLRVPEIVFACVDPAFGRSEPDEEIQDLLQASAGLNLGLHYLQGAITFDPAAGDIPHGLTASKIVLLDALITNVDRTARNTNMLMWHHELWLIDHGAALYFHHSWDDWQAHAAKPLASIRDHVLLPYATELDAAEKELKTALSEELIQAIIGLIPDEWLTDASASGNAAERRAVYAQYMSIRLRLLAEIAQHVRHARTAIV